MSADIETQVKELKEQISQMKPGPESKLAMIVFAGSLDKMLAALIIATGAAAMGIRPVLFFTFWGIAALRDARKKIGGKNFMATMFGWMLPKGRNRLPLSQMNMLGMGPAMIKGLMKKKNTADLDQLFEIAAQLGVEIKICEMSMDLMGFKREEMIDYPNIDYCGVATYLAEAQDASIQLFIS